MRTLSFVFLVVFSAIAQTQTLPLAPIPADPHEIVTGETRVPSNAAERGALVTLIQRAIDHYSLHSRGTAPHLLQINFTATRSTAYQGGPGTLRETWISGQNWRWDGTLPGYTLERISSNAAVYDRNPNGMVPMRIKMLANAVFAPIEGAPRRETLRTTAASWNGAALTCILTSGPGNPQVPAAGRQWFETEYCIDPATALLTIYSIAPGTYTIYEYSEALHFHDRVLPNRITIFENNKTVVDAQLVSISDINGADASPFTPTAQMIAQGPARTLMIPQRLPLRQARPSLAYVQPVIVHAIIDEHGTVRESEVLQDTALDSDALSLVQKMKLPSPPQASGAPATEREAYVSVQFFPAPGLLH